MLDLTGTATGNTVVTVTDAGDLDDSTYTVTVTGVDGDGTLGLDFDGATDIEDLAEQRPEHHAHHGPGVHGEEQRTGSQHHPGRRQPDQCRERELQRQFQPRTWSMSLRR